MLVKVFKLLMRILIIIFKFPLQFVICKNDFIRFYYRKNKISSASIHLEVRKLVEHTEWMHISQF